MRFFLLIVLFASNCFASNVSFYDYTISSGSTTAYTTLLASTPVNANRIYVCDTSGKLMKIASGTTVAAVDLFWSPVSGCQMFTIEPWIPAGTQLVIKSGGTTSSGIPTSGYNALSFFQ